MSKYDNFKIPLLKVCSDERKTTDINDQSQKSKEHSASPPMRQFDSVRLSKCQAGMYFRLSLQVTEAQGIPAEFLRGFHSICYSSRFFFQAVSALKKSGNPKKLPASNNGIPS